MLTRLWSRLWESVELALQHARPWDVLDILLVALPIYLLLVYARARSTRALPVALGGVLLVYLLAKRQQMVLTSLVFEFGLLAIVFAVVVVFQEDWRRFFGRAGALLGFGRRGGNGADARPVDLLLEGLGKLAEARIGALVVAPGREPLETHVEGGVALDGRTSVPLLLSLFDTSSPGHDGALLLSADLGRVERFGLHLPLSRALDDLQDRGTRHTAAKGLAERCDALIVVVSEERGTLSVAHEGQLYQDVPLAEVGARLNVLVASRAGARARRWRAVRWALRNPLSRVLALVLAAVLWFAVAFQVEVVQRTFSVPIAYRNLGEDLAVERAKPATVEVTLSGNARVFEKLNGASLFVSLDLAEVGAGRHRLKFSAEDVRRPDGLEVISIEPQQTRLVVGEASNGSE